MGFIRAYLAISVVGWHFFNNVVPPLTTGFVAVISFYMISGFYMSMVINDKYSAVENGTRAFYLSRILRLFPVYLIIMLSVMFFDYFYGVPSNFYNTIRTQPDEAIRYVLLASNFGILGLDAFPFLGPWKPGVGIIGVSWTLAIELQFYLVAPFIVTRSLRFCIGILALALTIRIALLGHEFMLWRYYFAPSVWCFFLLGHVSHRLSVLVSSRKVRKAIGIAAVAAIPAAAYLCGIGLYKDPDEPELWVFYLLFAAAIPFVFSLTKKIRLDALIGELSYPIYLIHLPLLMLMAVLFAGKIFPELLLRPVSFALVIGISAALHFGVELPINKVRAKLAERRTPRMTFRRRAAVANLPHLAEVLSVAPEDVRAL